MFVFVFQYYSEFLTPNLGPFRTCLCHMLDLQDVFMSHVRPSGRVCVTCQTFRTCLCHMLDLQDMFVSHVRPSGHVCVTC